MGDFTNSKPLSSNEQVLLWHVVSKDLFCTTFIASAGNVCKKISSGKSSVIILISNKKELDLLIPEILSVSTAWNFKYWQRQNFDLQMIVLLCVEQRAKGHEEGGFQCARDLRDEGWERAISGWRRHDEKYYRSKVRGITDSHKDEVWVKMEILTWTWNRGTRNQDVSIMLCSGIQACRFRSQLRSQLHICLCVNQYWGGHTHLRAVVSNLIWILEHTRFIWGVLKKYRWPATLGPFSLNQELVVRARDWWMKERGLRAWFEN